MSEITQKSYEMWLKIIKNFQMIQNFLKRLSFKVNLPWGPDAFENNYKDATIEIRQETLQILDTIEQKQNDLLAAMSLICYPNKDDDSYCSKVKMHKDDFDPDKIPQFDDDLPSTTNYDNIPDDCSW